MTSRRRFLAGLSALYATHVHPQALERTGKPARIATLETSFASYNLTSKWLVVAMRELGWVEGRNVVYEHVFADNDVARLPGLAAALVGRRPDVIFTVTTAPVHAVLASTRTIPVVMASFTDPSEFGIQSLAHPGGNVTGITNFGIQLGAKRLQLLKQAVPKIIRVGVLQHFLPAGAKELQLIEEASPALGVIVTPVPVKEFAALGAALDTLKGSGMEALLTTHSGMFMSGSRRIVNTARGLHIPLIAHRSEMVKDGALLSYSSILLEQLRRAAKLVDKVLKGTKPAVIPIEQPTKFELVVNLNAAKALGLTIPQSFLMRADRVIE